MIIERNLCKVENGVLPLEQSVYFVSFTRCTLATERVVSNILYVIYAYKNTHTDLRGPQKRFRGSGSVLISVFKICWSSGATCQGIDDNGGTWPKWQPVKVRGLFIFDKPQFCVQLRKRYLWVSLLFLFRWLI